MLRWFFTHSYRWNSDEPQHLHLVWAWANGLLPYRDVFDNHTPLFHVLFAPLFLWLGERADIVEPMRLAMLPFFALSLWLVQRLGAAVFSARAGRWTAILVAFFPKFFFKMGEFRTDVLWTVLWLGALLILASGPLTPKRLFFAGLTLGTAFGVSMKTALLLIIILSAGAMTWLAPCLLAPAYARTPSTSRERWSRAGAALAGLLLVPGLIISFFAAHGALGQLYYGVITHNTLPGLHTPLHLLARLFSFSSLVFVPALLLGATALSPFSTDPARASRRLFLLLATGFYYPLLHGLWTMITPQDNVPWFPLLFVSFVPAVLWLAEKAALRWPHLAPRVTLPLFLLVAEIVWMLQGRDLFAPSNAASIARIDDALRLTDAGEYLMDAKGENIYRPRPYFYVLEMLTRKQPPVRPTTLHFRNRSNISNNRFVITIGSMR